MLTYYLFNKLLVTLESGLNLKTHGFQGIFCNIVIILEVLIDITVRLVI